MAVTATDEQKRLLEFLERRHPRYDELLPHWRFLKLAYDGGRAWFEDGNLFKYFKEGDDEYAARVERGYRFNHTKEAVDLVNKYIFKAEITRKDDAPAPVQEFWKKATLSGLDIKQFMGTVSTGSSKLGMPWVFTDTTKQSDALSIAEARKQGARVYAYLVEPEDVLDVGYDRYGTCLWVLTRECFRDVADPIHSSGEIVEQFRLWEPNQSRLFEIVQEGTGKARKQTVIEVGPPTVYNLGEIPGFPVPHTVGEFRYAAPGLIDDIAYLDRACTNYLSNLDAIIQDQTFSQLAMPAQQLLPGESEYDALVKAGTKRIFVYDGEGGGKPEWISPDPKQASVILGVVDKIINEIYHTIGCAGERTKQDNAVGIDNSSGVAKAYDFERLNSLLTAKADSLENAENRLARLVMLWNGNTPPQEDLVRYADSFDVRGLFDEFAIAKSLFDVEAPNELRKEQMKTLVDKLWPRLSEDLKKTIIDDINAWEPPSAAQLAQHQAEAKAKFAGPPTKPNSSPSNRQGEVTKNTPAKR